MKKLVSHLKTVCLYIQETLNPYLMSTGRPLEYEDELDIVSVPRKLTVEQKQVILIFYWFVVG